MRRWKEEISSEKIEQYFQDVDVEKLTNGKYNCITLYRKCLLLSFAIYTERDINSSKIISSTSR